MCFSTAALTCKTDDTTSGLDTLDNWIKCFAAAIFYRVKPHEKIVVKCKCGAILEGELPVSNCPKYSISNTIERRLVYIVLFFFTIIFCSIYICYKFLYGWMSWLVYFLIRRVCIVAHIIKLAMIY